MITRSRKILHISQAHIAPGMSLTRWQDILERHGIPLEMSANASEWEKVGNGVIEAVFEEIREVVEGAKVDASIQ